MADLKLRFEFEPADGVSHPALRSTWARIEIGVGESIVTSVHDARGGGARRGVYGPAFLIAEWVVRNFWFLLNECSPSAITPSRAWLRRHSLVGAREGTSLPHFRLYRDEERVTAEWFAERATERQPVAFIESGRADLEPAQVRAALASAVDQVIEQLRGCSHPDVEALREDWGAIVEVGGDDLKLCRRAARMGLDAFEPGDVDDSMVRLLMETADRLPLATRDDLLDAGVASSRLAAALAAVIDVVDGDAAHRLHPGLPTSSQPRLTDDSRPYDRGYHLARELRQVSTIGSATKVDLKAVLERLKWGCLADSLKPWHSPDRNVKALVGFAKPGVPMILAPALPSKKAERFLVARGLYSLLSHSTEKSPRLLTGAGSATQSAGRAFAAELLAPADMIRARLDAGVDDERLEEIAEEFGVSDAVIRHQIDNHGLAPATRI